MTLYSFDETDIKIIEAGFCPICGLGRLLLLKPEQYAIHGILSIPSYTFYNWHICFICKKIIHLRKVEA